MRSVDLVSQMVRLPDSIQRQGPDFGMCAVLTFVSHDTWALATTTATPAGDRLPAGAPDGGGHTRRLWPQRSFVRFGRVQYIQHLTTEVNPQ